MPMIILLLLTAGVLSTWIYYRFYDTGGVLMPGILYTSCTLILFANCRISRSFRNLLIYYILMILTYYIIWMLCMLSSWFAIIGGPLAAGCGAWLSFEITRKFIHPVPLDNLKVFLAGALAFAGVVILYLIDSKEVIRFSYLFGMDEWPANFLIETFIPWQLSTGLCLYKSLSSCPR